MKAIAAGMAGWYTIKNRSEYIGKDGENMKILLTAINAKYIHSNLAVYSLKASSGRYRDDVEIAEYTINNYIDEILSSIYIKKPDLIAFSC